MSYRRFYRRRAFRTARRFGRPLLRRSPFARFPRSRPTFVRRRAMRLI